MSIPKFEDAVRTQWFHDDQSFVHELTVQFNAGFRQRFPSRLTGEVCERAQHECVEQLRRNVHMCAAGTCHNIKASWPSLFECDECGYSNDDTYCGSEWHFKFCPNCGRKVVDK